MDLMGCSFEHLPIRIQSILLAYRVLPHQTTNKIEWAIALPFFLLFKCNLLTPETQ